MDAITASEARRTLFRLIEAVNDDADTVEILSKKGTAVLMSADEYAALEETAHLLRSPANAARLLASLENARSDQATTQALVSGESTDGVDVA